MNWGIVLVILVLIVIAVALYGVSAYNGLVRQRNLVEESWRQVDVELNRRYDLIPNLVETVKGYATHERDTLESVVRLRNQAVSLAGGATPSEQRAGVEEQLTGAIRQLMVTVEAYPNLQANTNFVELQRQLAETEDRIAAGRRYYNANVRNYNTKIESFPTNILANMGGFQRATYFEVNDAAVRQAPKVSFGDEAKSDAKSDEAFETPNYSVRSGVQDHQPAIENPAQGQGTQFGYQAPQAEAEPQFQYDDAPRQAPGYGQAAPPATGYGTQPGTGQQTQGYTPPPQA